MASVERVAFLGMGITGSGMAANLARAGFELTVWNRTRERAEEFAEAHGARVAATPAEAGAHAQGRGGSPWPPRPSFAVEPRVARAAERLYADAEADGHGEHDFAAVVEPVERSRTSPPGTDSARRLGRSRP
jgi:3-hydroxyisobutyrate dehydrogenase-like beta-hydroxyacid dehydrogenase